MRHYRIGVSYYQVPATLDRVLNIGGTVTAVCRFMLTSGGLPHYEIFYSAHEALIDLEVTR